jgi:serine/threonine-protein kinase
MGAGRGAPALAGVREVAAIRRLRARDIGSDRNSDDVDRTIRGVDPMDDAAPEVILPALVPGTIIADRYRIHARLGAGGGAVWRCDDEKLGAPVALKIVDPGGEIARWRRDVAVARQIAHPNVCRVLDSAEGELVFVTMELVEGVALRDQISSQMPAEAARALLHQILAGAAALHAAGIAHRELRPENVIVERSGRAVIVDVGLARSPRIAAAMRSQPPEGPLHQTNPKVTVRVRGSRPVADRARPPSARPAGDEVDPAQYMAPEQAAGFGIDARADVWALGLVAHELLVGELPDGDRSGRRVDAAVDAKWPGIAPILRKCLEPLPTERFVDAIAIQAALTIQAAPPPNAVPLPGEIAKRRWWPFAIAAVAVIAAIATAIAIAR